MSHRDLNLVKKKRRKAYSSDEEDGSYSAYISEDRYRAMLGEHIQKYKRRVNNASASPASNQTGMPAIKGGLGSKECKLGNEHRGGSHKIEPTDFLTDVIPQKPVNYHVPEFAPHYSTDRFASAL